MIKEMESIKLSAYYKAQFLEVKEIFEEVGHINDLKSTSQFEDTVLMFLSRLEDKIKTLT